MLSKFGTIFAQNLLITQLLFHHFAYHLSISLTLGHSHYLPHHSTEIIHSRIHHLIHQTSHLLTAHLLHHKLTNHRHLCFLDCHHFLPAHSLHLLNCFFPLFHLLLQNRLYRFVTKLHLGINFRVLYLTDHIPQGIQPDLVPRLHRRLHRFNYLHLQHHSSSITIPRLVAE